MPVPNVAGGSVATSSWANAVADAINAIEDAAFDVDGDLSVAWAALTGVPTTFAPAAHAAAHAAAGADALTPAAIGAWRKAASGGTAGATVFVGPTDPGAGAVEGDIWIKG